MNNFLALPQEALTILKHSIYTIGKKPIKFIIECSFCFSMQRGKELRKKNLRELNSVTKSKEL